MTCDDPTGRGRRRRPGTVCSGRWPTRASTRPPSGGSRGCSACRAPRSLPRLYVEVSLGTGARVELDAAQANYLGNVMRMKPGDQLLAFDGMSGEWLAEVADAGKKRMSAEEFLRGHSIREGDRFGPEQVV